MVGSKQYIAFPVGGGPIAEELIAVSLTGPDIGSLQSHENQPTRLFLVLWHDGCARLSGLCKHPGPLRTICILAQELQPGLLEAFRDELHKIGYVEGVNIKIEVRDAPGQNDRLPVLAQELLAIKVEVIVAVNTPAAQAAKKATQTVPVVMLRVADPVKSGLVASLARPGGNLTGLSFMPDALGPKGVELLHQILPEITRMAALYRGDNPGAVVILDEVIRKAEPLGLKFVRTPVQSGSQDILKALDLAETAGHGGATTNPSACGRAPYPCRIDLQRFCKVRWPRRLRAKAGHCLSTRRALRR